MSLGPFTDLAQAMTDRARSAGAALFVNDRPDVARLTGADGVHVGQTDLPARDARKILVQGQLVGVSTHNPEQARQAVSDGADYLAIGPVFPTVTKANPDPVVGLEGVTTAAGIAHAAGLPLVAIGGIRLESAPRLFAAGADSIAVISDLFAGDWRALSERLREWIPGIDSRS